MRKYSHFLYTLLTITCFVFLCSCQGKSESQRWDENAYLDQALQGESINEEFLTPTPTATLQQTPDSKHVYASISDLCKLTDPNWSDDAAYQKALAAYDESIGENTIAKLKEDHEYGIGLAKFAIGYINEDDIPEVLVCFETLHPCGVHVFTWLPDAEKVAFVGTFSSFGGVSYAEKHNRIFSQYGNGGYYTGYETGISPEGKPELINISLSDGTGRNDQPNFLYYTGIPVPENVAGILDGSHQGFEKINQLGLEYDFEITDKYLVNNEVSGDDTPSFQTRHVDYDDMVLVTLKLIGMTDLD